MGLPSSWGVALLVTIGLGVINLHSWEVAAAGVVIFFGGAALTKHDEWLIEIIIRHIRKKPQYLP